ncbi:DMT family transporter [Halobacteriaceae archaeon GCM10025711]
MHRDRTDAAAPLTAAALWGGMYVVSKWGFGAIPPLTLGFLRVVLGAVVLLAVVRRRSPRRSFDAGERRRFVVLGFWVTATIATQFVGTELTTASQGSLLTVLTPVFTLLLGWLVLDERLTGRRVGGIALAAAGTLVVIAGQYDLTAMSTASVSGVLALLAASFAWAAFTVWGAPLVRRYSALETATYATVAAVPMLGVLVPVEFWSRGLSPADVPVTPGVVGAVLYLGVLSTATAWFLWYKGVEYLDAGAVAAFFFVQPLVGALLGTVLLDESLGTLFVVGGIIMGAGIYVVSTTGRTTRERRDGAETPE